MKIAVDIDEVLCKTNDYFLDHFNKEHNSNLKREFITDYTYNSFKNYGFENSYVFSKLVEFVRRDMENFNIVEEAVLILKELKKLGHELYILTSRSKILYERTCSWLENYFGKGFFKEIIFTDGFEKESICKSDVCINFGIDILIEDAPHYAFNTSQKGVKVLLMDCPWNYKINENENLVKVKNWNDIYQKLV